MIETNDKFIAVVSLVLMGFIFLLFFGFLALMVIKGI
jgi:hypothetical protein